MFMTALFTISEIWNQPRHSSSGWMMDKKKCGTQHTHKETLFNL
jgi:hypothetical protein